MKIDAHQHFWRYDSDQYGWIDDPMRAIRRDFLPADLAPLAAKAGIVGTVAVQARQTVEETRWLLTLANANPDLVRAVVGWVPLRELGDRIDSLLEELASHPVLKGVRHVLQGEPDACMENASFNAALSRLSRHGLCYDLLVFAPQLTAAIGLVDRHPDLHVVLDHIGKPVVQGSPSPDWIARIRDLARREHVRCKFSGVVTEVPGWRWTPELLRPYFEVVLDAFGPHRLMFGSDWPVCQVAVDYLEWHGFVQTCVAPLSPCERAAVLGDNAATFYRISPLPASCSKPASSTRS